jgi:excisionase family DNA binding protein
MLATGAPEASALHRWLHLLRERVPHFWVPLQGSGLERRPGRVRLSSIAAFLIDVVELPEALDSSVIVEPLDKPGAQEATRQQRFLLVRGLRPYRRAVSRGDRVIECEVQEYVDTDGGFLKSLREASMELCEQLETQYYDSTRTSSDEIGMGAGTTILATNGAAPVAHTTPRKETLRVKEVATILSVSEDAVLRRVQSGQIRALKLGRIWLIPKDEIRRLRGLRAVR